METHSHIDVGSREPARKDKSAHLDPQGKTGTRERRAGEDNDFRTLYEESVQDIREGNIVSGEVLKIEKDTVFVDIGYKSEGEIPLSEFQGSDGKVTIEEGDRVDVVLVRKADEKGYPVLSRKGIEDVKRRQVIEEAFSKGRPVRGIIASQIKGGYIVDIGIRAFLPGSHVDLYPSGEPGSWIGTEHEFKVISYDRRQGNVVVSRKVLLEEQKEDQRQETLDQIQEGAILEGRVRRVMDYGLLVDLGAVLGLVHITNLSWGKTRDISKKFHVGDEVTVKVLDYTPDKKRVSLGIKQLLPDPWPDIEKKYPTGTRIEAPVVALKKYGAFVEIEEGIEGLIPTSDLSWTRKIVHPSQVLDLGDDFTRWAHAQGPAMAPKGWQLVETIDHVRALCQVITELPADAVLAIDVETTGIDPLTAELISVGIAYSDGTLAAVIPASTVQIPGACELLDSMFRQRHVWVGHNGASYDMKVLWRYGLRWRPSADTMLLHYTVDERTGTHGLKALAAQYCGAGDYGIITNGWTYDPSNQLEVLKYNALDCYYTRQLYRILHDQATADGVVHIHDTLLLPASLVLAKMECLGIQIDGAHVRASKRELVIAAEEKEESLKLEAHKMGFSLNNVNSPKQLLPIIQTLIPGINTTSKEVLRFYRDIPFIDTLLSYRTAAKLISTYIAALEKVDRSGRLHGSFLLHGTVTGRLSSRGPNLQNIPHHADSSAMIRGAFIASDGYTLVDVDYSQLELRVAAWYSCDPHLLAIYKAGGDIHATTAARVFGVRPEDVTPEQRTRAKRIGFGIVYGMGPQALAGSDIQCSVQEAAAYIDAFYATFPGLKRWLEGQKAKALSSGMVVSAFGRKRRFPEFIPEDLKHEVIRQACNASIQSTASDICLHSLIRLAGILDWRTARILLTVHDSILFEIKDTTLSFWVPKIVNTMQRVPLKSEIPFLVDVKTGKRWTEMVKYV